MRFVHFRLLHQHLAQRAQRARTIDQVFGALMFTGLRIERRQGFAADAVQEFQIAHRPKFVGQVAEHEIGELQRVLPAPVGFVPGALCQQAEHHRHHAEDDQRDRRAGAQRAFAQVQVF